mgnify:CR=1 FL=1
MVLRLMGMDTEGDALTYYREVAGVSLADRRIIVTGASSGLGAHIVRHLAGLGASVLAAPAVRGGAARRRAFPMPPAHSWSWDRVRFSWRAATTHAASLSVDVLPMLASSSVCPGCSLRSLNRVS